MKRLKTFNEYNSGEDNNTIHHNLKGLIYTSGSRVLSLIHPLSAIESLDRRTCSVLCIGPRTEGELFLLVGLGFQKELIKGVDLISYSPWVDLGDMHNLEYADNTFDLIVMGWVLAYSHNPELAAQNVIRKAKQGAVIAISVEYATEDLEQQYESEFGYRAGHTIRMKHTNDILRHFGGAVDVIFTRYDIPDHLKGESGNVFVIFSIKK